MDYGGPDQGGIRTCSEGADKLEVVRPEAIRARERFWHRIGAVAVVVRLGVSMRLTLRQVRLDRGHGGRQRSARRREAGGLGLCDGGSHVPNLEREDALRGTMSMLLTGL